MIHDYPALSLSEWRSSCNSDEQLIRRIQALTMGLIDVSGVNDDYCSRMNGVDEQPSREDREIFDDMSVVGGAGSLDLELGETRTIQVIHESVRTFFLRDCFATLGKKLSLAEVIGESHLMIIETCLKFLNIAELDSLVKAKERSGRKVEMPFIKDTEVQFGARTPLENSFKDSVSSFQVPQMVSEEQSFWVCKCAISIYE